MGKDMAKDMPDDTGNEIGHQTGRADNETGTTTDATTGKATGKATGKDTGKNVGKRVLVVEDEPNITEAINFFLSRDGWDVFTHSNGHDALEALAHRAPDLLILDVMLPGRSGVEILRDLRADSRWNGLPVIMLTARGHSRDRAEAEAAGASRFMTKPFSNAEILEAVRELAP